MCKPHVLCGSQVYMCKSILVCVAGMLLHGHGPPRHGSFQTTRKDVQLCNDLPWNHLPGQSQVCLLGTNIYMLSIYEDNPNVFAVWRVLLQLNALSFYSGAVESCHWKGP